MTHSAPSPPFPCALALLTVAESYAADRFAAEAGIPGERLMEAAGKAVAEAAMRRYPAGPVTVLCGPGNNGGDGFVAARHLTAAGWPVRLALLGAREALKGDAATMAGRWEGAVEPLAPETMDGAALVIDGLFGAGLTRPLEGAARATVEAVAARALPVVAVDVPSGVHGNTGAVLGAAAPAAVTVTFFRRKPGHLLYPGRGLSGEVVVADIGIPEAALEAIAPATAANAPGLWRQHLRWPRPEDHKHARGHAIVVGGMSATGAARLAANAALRIGAGLVTLTTPPAVHAVYATALTAVMTAIVADEAGFADAIADPRRNAVLIGPGAGLNVATRLYVGKALAAGKATVLDADALSVFEHRPRQLFEAIQGPCVLTPHEGEYRRVFAHEGDKLARARAAAAEYGAVILLKSADTVIAEPGGRAAINENAPPTLATAGAGDVLAGLVVGLLAQGMVPFEAAAAAVWMHGEAAAALGPGLISEDLAGALPPVLSRLRDDGDS